MEEEARIAKEREGKEEEEEARRRKEKESEDAAKLEAATPLLGMGYDLKKALMALQATGYTGTCMFSYRGTIELNNQIKVLKQQWLLENPNLTFDDKPPEELPPLANTNNNKDANAPPPLPPAAATKELGDAAGKEKGKEAEDTSAPMDISKDVCWNLFDDDGLLIIWFWFWFCFSFGFGFGFGFGALALSTLLVFKMSK